MKTMLLLILLFFDLMNFANNVYFLISAPLIQHSYFGTPYPTFVGMSSTNMASLFFTPVKLTALLALVLPIPFILYQI